MGWVGEREEQQQQNSLKAKVPNTTVDSSVHQTVTNFLIYAEDATKTPTILEKEANFAFRYFTKAIRVAINTRQELLHMH